MICIKCSYIGSYEEKKYLNPIKCESNVNLI